MAWPAATGSENIISDATTRKAHIDAIVALASGWASALPDARGIEIAYDGVSAVAREAMTAFVQELAAALHAAGQQLAVRIDPAAVGTSDSGYDLRAIGAAADVVRVAAPSDPAAYADGTIDHLLTQLTATVDRRKLGWSSIPTLVVVPATGARRSPTVRR